MRGQQKSVSRWAIISEECHQNCDEDSEDKNTRRKEIDRQDKANPETPDIEKHNPAADATPIEITTEEVVEDPSEEENKGLMSNFVLRERRNRGDEEGGRRGNI